MKGVFLSVLFFIIGTNSVLSQQQNYKPIYDNIVPVAPTAFQFLKYTEMPVSEYTGIPNLSVPIYTIIDDGVEIPITLRYHAGGNRVNQEASWVGLGWDLTLGSVIQIINDRDDIDQLSEGSTITSTYPKYLPDFYSNALPGSFPYRYNYWSYCTTPQYIPPGGAWPPGPINTPVPDFGYMIITDGHFPMEGNYNIKKDQFLEYVEYDSEPDVFKANFLGHSLTFVRPFTNFSNEYIVLNKAGYKIRREGNATADKWVVTIPSGEVYFFEERINTMSLSSSANFMGSGGSNPSDPPSTKTWMLTKIITRNKKIIQFNYTRDGIVRQFPLFTQTYTKMSGYSSQMNSAIQLGSVSVGTITPGNGCIDCYGTTITNVSEDGVFLSSILFTNGRLDFTTSNRNDLSGGRKLDRIEIKGATLIKSAQFSYSYFDATSVNGPGFTVIDDNFNRLRLKLNSIEFNDGSSYTFDYNSVPLPKKNSFAVDYWGYYNGNHSNISMVPNPIQFNRSDIGWTNNDNHSARIEFAKAAILERITYPTGGSTVLDYGLNEFDNYWVPDYTTSSNTVSKGNGLRVQTISFFTHGNAFAQKTTYQYEGGKALQPRQIIRNFSYSTVQNFTTEPHATIQINHWASVNEISSNGFFSTNPFGSINGVGYTKVISRQVNEANESLGRTETVFVNNPDKTASSAVTNIHLSTMLPMIKRTNEHENGTAKEINYYNAAGEILKKIVNTYSTIVSDIRYGARVYFYGLLLHQSFPYCSWGIKSQYMFGYYPIFDIETRLSQTQITEYSNGMQKITNEFYGYDYFGLLSSKSIVDPVDNTQEVISYQRTYDPSIYTTNPVRYSMYANNFLSDIWKVTNHVYLNGTYPPVTKSEVEKTYKFSGSDKYAEDIVKITERKQVANNSPKEISYDVYDASNGNLLQYTSNGASNSLIWGYNNDLVVASIKNASQDRVAYTSFEGEGSGNWNFNSANRGVDINAPVGDWVYNLNSAPINKNNQPAGNYVLSYWSNSGPKTVTGSLSVLTGRTVNFWTLYEHKVVLSAATTISLSGTGFIDDLKLFPERSQMTSYTHKPLVGILTQCSPNNNITYFEYDFAGRLVVEKDQDKNVIKKYCYSYSGQQNVCDDGTSNTAPVINSLTQTASLTINVDYTSISGCTGATITYLDLVTNQSAGSTGGCNTPRTRIVPTAGRTYRITVTCYSATYPGGITSQPVDIFIPY
ncbi:MAG: hypothetical protein HEQ40_15910 [Lacibacter sp.]|jgi:hypothetical protein